jgi:hypothetical protein
VAKRKRHRQSQNRPKPITVLSDQQPRSVFSKVALAVLALLFVVFYFRLLFGINYLWEDVIEQHYPNIVYTMHSLKNTGLPQWTPYVFGGMPYMADMQTGLFYPPNWILFLLHTFTAPGGIVFIWFILIHILIFGLGVFLLGRAFELSPNASLFTAATLMFCGFISTHIIHIILIYVITWFPYAFLFLKKAYEKGSIRHLGIASLFFGISILGGYAQYTLFCSTMLLVYTLFTAFERRSNGWKQPAGILFFFGLFMGLSAGLALVQFLPTMELSSESVRTKMTWEESVKGSLSLKGLITLLAPKFYGWVTGMAEVDRATGRWVHGAPYWGGQGMHLFWETAVFIGVLPVLLIAAAFPYLYRNKIFLLFSIMGILALLTALGKNSPLYYLIFHLPGFKTFRHPGRFSFIFSFCTIFASGLSLNYLLGAAGQASADLKQGLKAATITCAIICAILLLSLTTLGGLEEAKQSTAQLAAFFGIFSAVAGLGLLYYLIRSKAGLLPVLGLIIFVFFELFMFGHKFGCGKVSGKEVYAENQGLEKIKTEMGKTPFRLQGRIFEGPGKGVRLFRQLNMGNVYHIPLVEGYNQLHLKRLSRFVHEVSPEKEMALFNVKYRPRTDGKGFFIAPPGGFCERFSLRSNVSYADSAGSAIGIINNPDFDPMQHAVVESRLNLHLDPALPPDGLGIVTIREMTSRTIELDIEARANALLFASEVWYPAWRARLDGKEVPVLRTNFLFRGIEIPRGRHKVNFYYQSKAFGLGKMLSLISLVVCLILVFGFQRLPAKWATLFDYMRTK